MIKINALARKAIILSSLTFLSTSILYAQTVRNNATSTTPPDRDWSVLATDMSPNSFGSPTIVRTTGTSTSACLDNTNDIQSPATFQLNVSGLSSVTYTWSLNPNGSLAFVAPSSTNTVSVIPVKTPAGNLPGILTVTYRGVKDSSYSVTYTPDSCGGPGKPRTVPITIQIPKSGQASVNLVQKFTHDYPIIGNTCIAEGDSLTFSIAPIVSSYEAKDGYNWTKTTSFPFTVFTGAGYSSLDNSSVTGSLETAPTFPCSLMVNVGACNQAAGDTKYKIFKRLMDAPVASISGQGTNQSPCLPPSVSSITLGISNVDDANIDYEWTLPNPNFSFASGSDKNSLAPIINITNGASDKIYLKATPKSSGAFCLRTNSGPLYDTLSINRTLAGVTIDGGLGGTCKGISTNNGYSLSNQSIAVNWSVPPGWTMISNQGSTTLLVDVTSGAGSNGVITAVSVACPTDTAKLFVYTKPSPLTGEISGPTCLTPGDVTNKTYSVTATDLASSYQWKFPSGWTIVSGDNTNSVTVTPNGTTVDSITVVAIGGCENSNKLFKIASFAPIKPTDINASKICFNAGPNLSDNVNLEVANPINGQSYIWSTTPTNPDSDFLLGGFGNIGSAINATAVASTSGEIGSYTVKVVTSSLGCSIKDSTSKVFSVATNHARIDSSYDGEAGTYRFVVRNNATNDFFVNGTTYQWYKNGNPVGLNNRLLTLGDSPTTYATISVVVTTPSAACSTKVERGTNYSNYLRTDSPTTAFNILLSPNPAQDEAGLKITNFSGNKADVTIVDQSGNVVEHFTTTQAKTTINTSGYASGIYIITVVDGNNKQTTKLSVVK